MCFGISEVLTLITSFDPYNIFVKQGGCSYLFRRYVDNATTLYYRWISLSLLQRGESKDLESLKNFFKQQRQDLGSYFLPLTQPCPIPQYILCTELRFSPDPLRRRSGEGESCSCSLNKRTAFFKAMYVRYQQILGEKTHHTDLYLGETSITFLLSLLSFVSDQQKPLVNVQYVPGIVLRVLLELLANPHPNPESVMYYYYYSHFIVLETDTQRASQGTCTRFHHL